MSKAPVGELPPLFFRQSYTIKSFQPIVLASVFRDYFTKALGSATNSRLEAKVLPGAKAPGLFRTTS
jgi:hypothetical protein